MQNTLNRLLQKQKVLKSQTKKALTVNGEEARYEVNKAYWSIMVNGEYGMYGASEQVVNDGDLFQLVYTIG